MQRSPHGQRRHEPDGGHPNRQGEGKKPPERAGDYRRKPHTKAGEVALKVPKLHRGTFEAAMIEHDRRREIAVKAAIVPMSLAGVWMRWVADITEALWGRPVSAGAVSKLNQKVYWPTKRWRNQPLAGDSS